MEKVEMETIDSQPHIARISTEGRGKKLGDKGQGEETGKSKEDLGRKGSVQESSYAQKQKS